MATRTWNLLGFVLFALLALAFPLRWLMSSVRWADNADADALKFFCTSLFIAMILQAAFFGVVAVVSTGRIQARLQVIAFLTAIACLIALLVVGTSW